MTIPHPRRVRFELDSDAMDPGVPVRNEVRLRVKPDAAADGSVDGAWWPRSRDPAAEFPELVLAMSSWVGPVRRVAYHPGDWNTTAPELMVEGWLVNLVGSALLQAHAVMVVGSGQRRMSLLVVPPNTPGSIARAVLREATGPGTIGAVEEVLATNGIDSRRSGTASASPAGERGDIA